MGLLGSMVAKSATGTPADAKTLIDVIFGIGCIDGKLEATEQTAIEAMLKTVPQLKKEGLASILKNPPKVNRKDLIDGLAKVDDEKLRKQCFVLAVEMALSSGGVNESEDQYMEHVRKALRIDDAFARDTISVVAAKYTL